VVTFAFLIASANATTTLVCTPVNGILRSMVRTARALATSIAEAVRLRRLA
jgi:hypothetical protein